MQHSQWIILATVVALPLLGCGDAAGVKQPAEVHATVIEGRITLSATAAKRLEIAFAEIKGTPEKLEAPYNGLLYDANGGEWVFVSPATNVFVRAPVKVDSIVGEKVHYTKGPPAGTKIVTMGAAELFGIEFGVGK